MELILYENFSKRSNSTKRPAGGYSVNVKLKNNTSVESPVFFIDGVNLSVNYCKWDNNYYFITDIVLGNNNIYELHCTIDVLASFKEYIQNTRAYIEYASSRNLNIPDNRIPLNTTPTVTLEVTEKPAFDLEGSYYVAVTGIGKVGFYKALSRNDIDNLVFDIRSAYFPSEADNIADAIVKAGQQLVGSGSLSENIKACYWMPFKAPVSTSAEFLHVGMYETNCQGYEITNLTPINVFNLTIPWQHTDWRNTSPYTEVYLYLPYIGMVSYPASNLVNASTITVRRCINVASGSIAYEVTANNGLELGIYSADIAVAIPIGSSSINPATAAGGLLSGVAAAVTAPTVAGKIFGAASASVSGIQALNTSSGGIGGGAGSGLNLYIYCYVVTHNTVVEPYTFADIWGYPIGIVDSIGNYSGYIQCSDFSCDAPLHDDERNQLNALLNSGIYLE